MEFSQLIKKNVDELNELLNDYRAELFTLRFKNKTGQLDNSHKIKAIRKDIAKTLTAIKQIQNNKITVKKEKIKEKETKKRKGDK